MAKKAGLGKGLVSLMGEADAETAAMKSDSVLPISKVKPNKGQPRKTFDETELSELADSIKQNGILQPILVRKVGASYEIVAGERRYQAAKLAGLDEVPVVIREISDEDVFKLALIENLQRSNLTLLDEKELTQEELSKILSKSRSAITNTLRLMDLPTEVQDLLEAGRITAGHARAILAVPTEEGRIRLAEKVVNENLSVRQTERLAPLFSGTEEPSKPRREPAPQSFKRAARELRQALNTNVKIKNVRGKNKIEIEFADEDMLAHIVEMIAAQNPYGDE